MPLVRAEGEPAMRWATVLPPVISLLVLVAVVLSVRGIDLARVAALVPRAPGFWIAFAASYLALPVANLVIFRRLLGFPLGAGFGALLRKLVCNELLLGYLGEAVLFGWARRRRDLTGDAFGAIKDVAILSAVAGNIATLVLLAVTWPLVGGTRLGLESRPVVLSLAVVLASSFGAMLLRRRIFTLDHADLYFVLGVHLARIAAGAALTAIAWHIALPAVPIAWWGLLAMLRQLVSRLPLVPNKDVVFAGLTILALGHEADIVALMALMATLVVLTHVLVGAGLVLADVLGRTARG